jgi:predicted Fe-Mo cluster-binding NifX family protein
MNKLFIANGGQCMTTMQGLDRSKLMGILCAYAQNAKRFIVMKICIPVTADKGLSSPVSAHFGSAPLFMVVDSDSMECTVIKNSNQHHAHGMCQPLAVLSGTQIDGIVVGGIGLGALNKLNSANLQVFQSKFSTVKETVDAFKAGTLQPMTAEGACGHGRGSCGG